MSGENFDIFISYRRSDGTNTARLFKSEFERRGYRAFLDFDDLTDGKFDKKIENAIIDAQVFVMILTNDYFARCNEEDDWVRREIECALENEKVIIPVNYDGNLNGIPDYLEPKLKREIGLHQFSTVYADAAFQVTFDKMIKDRVAKVINVIQKEDPQPQPQPRPKPKPVQTDFNTEYNRCMTTEQYPEAFAACLNEAVLRQNVSSIITKANSVIANLKGRILIPDCVAHVSYDWLTYRLSAKGYLPIKRHEDSISYKKIRFRISKTRSNITQVNIGWNVNMFLLLLFFFVYFLSLVFAIGAVGTFLFESRVWIFSRRSFIKHLILVFVFIFILIFLSITIVRFFKRKKKAIRDVAKICLEECER